VNREEDPDTIESSDLDWDKAVVRPGHPHGAVVSVRLDPADADRLRTLAAQLDLNLSQVIRRALAAFEPARLQAIQRQLAQTLQGFTYGGSAVNLISYSVVYPQRPEEAKRLETAEQVKSSTEPTRIVEHVTA
jgi:predicted transcriptional regulator